MKRIKNIFFISIILIQFCSLLFGQNKYYRFLQTSTTDGLPSNTIMDIYQDKMGLIWIGSRNGLVKYDGYSYKYVDEEGEIGKLLKMEIIASIAEDDFENIYAGGNSGSLYVINKTSEVVEKIALKDSNSKSIELKLINYLLVHQNVLWISTATEGLIGYDIETKKVLKQIKIPSKKDPAYSTFMYQVEIDSSGNMWVASGIGMLKFANDYSYVNYTDKILVNMPENDYSVNCFLFDRNDNLWVSFWEKGLARINIKTEEYDLLRGVHKDSTRMPSAQIWEMIETENGDIFFAT